MCLFSPLFHGRERSLDVVTRGNETPAVPKHTFCWGRLSPAAAPLPGSPLTVSRWRQSRGSGGTGWLCGRCPGTPYPRWCSAERINASEWAKFTHANIHLRLNKTTASCGNLTVPVMSLSAVFFFLKALGGKRMRTSVAPVTQSLWGRHKEEWCEQTDRDVKTRQEFVSVSCFFSHICQNSLWWFLLHELYIYK